MGENLGRVCYTALVIILLLAFISMSLAYYTSCKKAQDFSGYATECIEDIEYVELYPYSTEYNKPVNEVEGISTIDNSRDTYVDVNNGTIVNTDSYNDSTTSIVYESEPVNYGTPIIICAILLFVYFISNRIMKYKESKYESTERILSKPLSTFSKEEIEMLKSKY